MIKSKRLNNKEQAQPTDWEKEIILESDIMNKKVVFGKKVKKPRPKQTTQKLTLNKNSPIKYDYCENKNDRTIFHYNELPYFYIFNLAYPECKTDCKKYRLQDTHTHTHTRYTAHFLGGVKLYPR